MGWGGWVGLVGGLGWGGARFGAVGVLGICTTEDDSTGAGEQPHSTLQS